MTRNALHLGKWLVLSVAAAAALAPAGAAALTAEDAQAVVKAAGRGDGLCAVLGEADGKAAVGLARAGNFLVHALAADEAAAEAARKHVDEQKLSGRVTVEAAGLAALPYADNLVNIVLAEDMPALLKAGLSVREVMRAVCPDGAAFFGGLQAEQVKADLAAAGLKGCEAAPAGRLVKVAKPRPAEMDDWPQQFHGPDRNAVSHDRLMDVPTGVRWIAGSEYPRGHRKNSTIAVVSARGRNFYYTANAAENLVVPRQKPGERGPYYLIARDAFNGLLLWQHPWEVGSVYNGGYNYYNGPIPLATDGERVFAGLKKNSLVILDAATGGTLKEVALGAEAVEVALSGPHVVVATAEVVRAIDPASGAVKWNYAAAVDRLVMDESNLYLVVGGKVPPDLVSLDAATCKVNWRASTTDWQLPPPDRHNKWQLRLCTLQAGVLLALDSKGVMYGISAADGKRLWTAPAFQAHQAHSEPMFINGAIWVLRSAGKVAAGGEEGPEAAPPAKPAAGPARPAFTWQRLDPATGKASTAFSVPYSGSSCGRNSATDRFALHGKSVGLTDLATGKFHTFGGIRAPCTVELLPANGLLYTHPIACRCNSLAVRGFVALASDPLPAAPAPDSKVVQTGRLVKGPAYGSNPQSAIPNAQSDWPTFRHDPARSGRASTELPTDLEPLWQADLALPDAGGLARDWRLAVGYGDPLSAMTVAGGTVYVAVPDAHRLVALDAATGAVRWQFLAGGRIDSPPTIDSGLCFFGAKDGWVYCLTAEDGRLVWRSRAAPVEKRVVAFGQLESPWPVSGAVLVDKGTAYVSAGRSSTSDGGYSLCALEAATGKLLSEERLGTKVSLVYQSVLAAYGATGCMGSYKFPLQGAPPEAAPPKYSLKGDYGFLRNAWRRIGTSLHRGQGHWTYGRQWGYLMCFDERLAYGYKESEFRGKGKVGDWGAMPPCQIFGGDPDAQVVKYVPTALWTWAVPEPAQVEAMLLAGQTLFAAGSTDKIDPKAGRMWILSAPDGRLVKEFDLPAPPVFDGLAAAGGRLFLAAADGKVSCFGKK